MLFTRFALLNSSETDDSKQERDKVEAGESLDFTC